MRLTDLSIKRLPKPLSGQKTYFDDSVKGFGLRVSQGGTKSFIVLCGMDRKRRTIGRYPEWSLADARAEAKRIIGEASIEKLTGLPSVPFGKARERFLADTERRTKPRTVEEYRRLLYRHFRYEKALDEITRQDIMRVIELLNKTPSEAKHAFVAIRTMMNWCYKQGLVESSPVPPMKFKQAARSRILNDEELVQVWQRAEHVGYPYGTIIRLLIATGQRRGEIAGLRWSWINKEKFVFPEGFTKNKREHHVPIGPLTKKLLRMVPKHTDRLFPSRFEDDKPFNGWAKCKRHFDSRLTFSDFTLHDLRRTYSSNLARLGVPIHVTERLLNHVSGTVSGVAAVYNRYSYWDEMVDADTRLAEFLEQTFNRS